MASEIRLNLNQVSSVLSCKNCGKTDVKLQQCGRCHFERYCGQPCQIAHWPKHKQVCQLKEKQPKAALGQQEPDYFSLGEEAAFSGQVRQAIGYYEKGLQDAYNLDKRKKGEVYAILGRLYFSLNEYRKVIVCSEERLKIAKDLDELEEQGKAYENLGVSHNYLKEYARAIECLKKRLVIAKDLNDKKGVITAYGNLGIAYNALAEHQFAIDSYKDCIKVAQEIKSPQEGIAYNNLGNVYDHLKKYEPAEICHKKSFEIANRFGDKDTIAKAVTNRVWVLIALKKHKEATEWLGNILSQTNDKLIRQIVLENLGLVYRDFGDSQQAIVYYNELLSIAQIKPDRLKEAKAHLLIGLANKDLEKYSKAIDCFQKFLTIIRKFNLHSPPEEIIAYNSLGKVYFFLADYQKTRHYHEKALEAAKKAGDQTAQGDSYEGLGNAELFLGNFKEALTFLEKALKIADQNKDPKRKGSILSSKGSVYNAIGEYTEAIKLHEEGLAIAQSVAFEQGEETCYGNMGMVYFAVGQYEKAREFHEKALKIAEKSGSKSDRMKHHINIGNALSALGKYQEALEVHKKALLIACALGEKSQIANCHGNLGIAFQMLKRWEEAVKSHRESLNIAEEIGDKPGIKRTCINLGALLNAIGKYQEAITCYQRALEIAQDVDSMPDQVAIARCYNNLGIVFENLEDLNSSEDSFLKSIKAYSSVHENLKENNQWKITIFEEQFKAYIGLETVLSKQDSRKLGALEVTDARRSRALLSILSKRLGLNNSSSIFLKIGEMHKLANDLGTTFIVYSLNTLDEKDNRVWVVSPNRDIVSQSLSLNGLSDEMRSLHSVSLAFPYALSPPQIEEELSFEDKFNEQLTKWYDVFIRPIASSLPKDPWQTLTIVAEGLLSILPIAAFRDKKGKYLIEKHPISIAPSIKVLELLNQLPKSESGASLIVAHPTTPNSNDNNLEFAEKQALKIVAPLLNTPKEKIFNRTSAVANRVVKEMASARWIHLSCHGTLGNMLEEKSDSHSVFEGLFKLAADKNHPKGYLQSQEIAFLNLSADLVFMNACFSGRGKLQKEGTIGPVWSFLAAGARSTIGTYWGLLDTELTNQMVEIFYKHLLGKGDEKLNKAQALQKALLQGIKKDRDNPRQWAAFFLSGLQD